MSSTFYEDLPAFEDFTQVADLECYHPVPDDWSVAVSDVVDSTGAIESGAYKEVNAVGTSCIVAGLNAASTKNIPYVFGGDGAALVLPPGEEEAVGRALRMVRAMARNSFGLELRAGVVPVSALAAEGRRPMVARYRASEDLSLAMFAGGGLEHAETLVKTDTDQRYALPDVPEEAPAHDADLLENFHCRWEPIESRRGEMLTLLVTALGDEQARYEAYQRMLSFLGGCEKEAGDLRPMDRSTLRMSSRADDFNIESRVRTGARDGMKMKMQRLKIASLTRVGRLLRSRGMSMFDPEDNDYIGQVVANSDFRKFDDTLRMVLDVSPGQRADIEAFLSRERERGAIAYGTHVSGQALMTCMVENFEGDHVHFVDGADGGYALAAKQLKRQLG